MASGNRKWGKREMPGPSRLRGPHFIYLVHLISLFLLVLCPVFCFVCFTSSEVFLDSIIFRKESPELTYLEWYCTKLHATSKTHTMEKLPKPQMDKYLLTKTFAPQTPKLLPIEEGKALRHRSIKRLPGL